MDAKDLEAVPLFAGLSKKERQHVARLRRRGGPAPRVPPLRPGRVRPRVLRAARGDVEVTQDGRHLTDLGPGDFFGEVALDRGRPTHRERRRDDADHGDRDAPTRLRLDAAGTPARGRADPRGRARAVAASPRRLIRPRHRDAAGRTLAALRRTHRPSTPDVSSTRWFRRGSRTRSPSEPANPAFGSSAPNTTRSTRASTIAPAHIAHGSSVTTSVHPSSRHDPVRRAASRNASISACAVGSPSRSLALPAAASHDRRHAATTAPTGTSPDVYARPRLVERQTASRPRRSRMLL